MKCAVGSCKQKQSHNTKQAGGKYVSFYKFPKDPDIRKLWIKFCNRVKPINVQREGVCSLHFKQEDFERNLKFEMGFSCRRSPILKPGAIPTLDYSDDKSIRVMTEVNENSFQRQKEAEIELQNVKDLKNADKNERTPTLYAFKQLCFLSSVNIQNPSKKIFLIPLQDFRKPYVNKNISYLNSNTAVSYSTENCLNGQVSVQQESNSPNEILSNTEETEINAELDYLSQMECDQTKNVYTEEIDIKPEIYQEEHSLSTCDQEDLVFQSAEKNGQNQDTHQKLYSLWSQKLTKFGTSQRAFAEKLINDVLFNGELGLLNSDTSLTNLSVPID